MKPIVTKKEFFSTYNSTTFANKTWQKYNHLFPIYPSTELAEIVASLLTDGIMDIRKRYHSKYFGYIGFYSKNEIELKRINNQVNKLFGIQGQIREWGTGRFGECKGLIIIKAVLTRILFLCGVAPKNKVAIEYGVPKWIKKSNKQIKSAFLKRSFSCEGSISYNKNRKKWEISYGMFKSKKLTNNCLNYLNDLRDILKKEFNINSNIYKKQEYIRKKDNLEIIGWNLRIDKIKDTINYGKHIGFDIEYKQQRLLKAINQIS